jgi:hypothetical protein
MIIRVQTLCSAAAHPVDARGGPSRDARHEEFAMRPMLIALAATAFIAAPAAAQQRMSEKIQDYAPAIDRSADALLNLDLGPILDAADPYRRHHRRTLRDMARRDDPDFERRMHATIYGTAATMGRAADAFAAAEPAMRQALSQFERDMAAAIYAPPPPRGSRPQDRPPPPPHDDADPWGD